MAEEDAIKRVMPHSIEAEQSVIGAMLMDAEAIEVAMETLREEDFYARQYGVLFTAITEMHQKGMAVDPVTLQTRLREMNLPPEVYGSSTILELIEQVPTSANIKSYAKIVSEKALLRKCIHRHLAQSLAAAGRMRDDTQNIFMEFLFPQYTAVNRRFHKRQIQFVCDQLLLKDSGRLDRYPDLRIGISGLISADKRRHHTGPDGHACPDTNHTGSIPGRKSFFHVLIQPGQSEGVFPELLACRCQLQAS